MDTVKREIQINGKVKSFPKNPYRFRAVDTFAECGEYGNLTGNIITFLKPKKVYKIRVTNNGFVFGHMCDGFDMEDNPISWMDFFFCKAEKVQHYF